MNLLVRDRNLHDPGPLFLDDPFELGNDRLYGDGCCGLVRPDLDRVRDCAYPYAVFLMPIVASARDGQIAAAKPEFGSATARAVLLIAKSDIRPSDPSLPRKKNDHWVRSRRSPN
jgi:hypothetical protein